MCSISVKSQVKVLVKLRRVCDILMSLQNYRFQVPALFLTSESQLLHSKGCFRSGAIEEVDAAAAAAGVCVGPVAAVCHPSVPGDACVGAVVEDPGWPGLKLPWLGQKTQSRAHGEELVEEAGQNPEGAPQFYGFLCY